MMTATVDACDGRLRVTFEPIEEGGEAVGVGAIAEASTSRCRSKIVSDAFDESTFHAAATWWARERILVEGLQPAILTGAEVVE